MEMMWRAGKKFGKCGRKKLNSRLVVGYSVTEPWSEVGQSKWNGEIKAIVI
jgi:hypothetical protein